MLEVCFSDSVKGGLALAQHCGNDVIGGTVCFVTDQKGLLAFCAKRKAFKEYRKKRVAFQKQAVPLGGTREDLAGLSFCLSEGDIRSPICLTDCPRKEHLHAAFFFDRYHEEDMEEAAFNEFWERCVLDWDKLKSNPPQIRVWLDQTPEAQCGLLFLADLLRNCETEIHIVELPEKIMRADLDAVECRSWGEVEPELYGTFLGSERILTREETADFAERWDALKAENAPLRIVENGFVHSADIDYYDDRIRGAFPNDTCKIAHIVGNALGKQHIPTGDVFVAKRIQTLIDAGELKIIGHEKDGFYGTVVRCAE